MFIDFHSSFLISTASVFNRFMMNKCPLKLLTFINSVQQQMSKSQFQLLSAMRTRPRCVWAALQLGLRVWVSLARFPHRQVDGRTAPAPRGWDAHCSAASWNIPFTATGDNAPRSTRALIGPRGGRCFLLLGDWVTRWWRCICPRLLASSAEFYNRERRRAKVCAGRCFSCHVSGETT